MYEELGRRAPQRLDQDAEFTDLIRQRLTGDSEHRRRLILISVCLQQRFLDELPAKTSHGVLIRPERRAHDFDAPQTVGQMLEIDFSSIAGKSVRRANRIPPLTNVSRPVI